LIWTFCFIKKSTWSQNIPIYTLGEWWEEVETTSRDTNHLMYKLWGNGRCYWVVPSSPLVAWTNLIYSHSFCKVNSQMIHATSIHKISTFLCNKQRRLVILLKTHFIFYKYSIHCEILCPRISQIIEKE